MQAFGFLARKVGALFFEEIGALLDFLVGRADDEFFGFGYALFGGLGVGAALILTAFVLALPKRAALVFRLPLFTVSTANGASAARQHFGKQSAMPNSTRDLATSRRRSICVALNDVSGCLNLRHCVYNNRLCQSFNQSRPHEIGSLKI